MKKVILLVVLMLCTVNWMYLSENKLKWATPVLNFMVNPNFIGLKSAKNQNYFVQEIVSASGLWFQKTETNIAFQYKGITSDKPSSLENITCDDLTRPEIQQKEIVFYADTNSEYECGSASCVYIWSCRNSIVQADVIFNNENFNFSEIGTDGDVAYLRSEALKSFGYILGLGHCNPGDTKEDCLARGGKDPAENTLLYKLGNLGKVETISEDEIAGVESIYGKKKSLFPKEGKYAMNYKELYAVLEVKDVENIIGMNAPSARQNIVSNFNSLRAYTERKTGKEMRLQYDEFFAQAYSYTPQLTKSELEFQLLTVNLGIISADKFKEDIDNGILNFDKSFLEYVVSKHHQLRNYTKDNLEGK